MTTYSHPAALPVAELLKQCDSRRTRRSGPGGQHRNKVETAAIITHRPTGVSAEANERRSLAENQEQATFRLRVSLAIQHRGAVSANYEPSDLWRSRCRDGKLVINPEHGDFPSLLAEALDIIAAWEMDVKAAAEGLGCTTSQLVKLLQHEPRAMALVNRERENRGLRRLA